MRRREFIAGLAGTAALPFAAHAQQAMPVIGFMHIASAGPMSHILAAFRQGLNEVGIREGRDVTIEFRWAEGRYEWLAPFAADLVRQRVALIVTGGGDEPALAAKAATTTIPIVFNVGRDPVKTGLVASIARPGGNVTGVNILTAELSTKRLGFLNDLLPKDAVIGHLVNPKLAATDSIVAAVAEAARTMGREIMLLRAGDAAEIDAVFASLQPRAPSALLVAADPFFNARRDQLVRLVARAGIPAAYEQREFAVAGGLLTYSTSLPDSYRQMGVYVGRILKGEKPADLPVMQPTKFQLVVNLKTAKALGLTLPSGLMSIIDEVIE
jgi:putative ABC transport system substrate-binding protein